MVFAVWCLAAEPCCCQKGCTSLIAASADGKAGEAAPVAESAAAGQAFPLAALHAVPITAAAAVAAVFAVAAAAAVVCLFDDAVSSTNSNSDVLHPAVAAYIAAGRCCCHASAAAAVALLFHFADHELQFAVSAATSKSSLPASVPKE